MFSQDSNSLEKSPQEENVVQMSYKCRTKNEGIQSLKPVRHNGFLNTCSIYLYHNVVNIARVTYPAMYLNSSKVQLFQWV